MPETERILPCNRRAFIGRLAAAGMGGSVLMPWLVRQAVAMGRLRFPSGMQRVVGRVTINGRPAREGDLVASGDVVATGADSTAIFVHDQSVYLLRADSRFELLVENPAQDPEGRLEVLNNLAGRVLAAFARRGTKRILTTTAVLGVRGSAAYVESFPRQTYFCLCYGKASVSPIDDSSVHQEVATSHHEQPLYINGPGFPERIQPAPMKNHSDSELFMLEAMAGRKPPFEKMGYD